MSDFQEELRRRDQAGRERSERGQPEAEQAATAEAGAAHRWLQVIVQRCGEAQASTDMGIQSSAPRAERGGRYIQEFHRGDPRRRKTLRLVLDEPASLLTWQHAQAGEQHVQAGEIRESGRVNLGEAEPDETIRNPIGDFVEWSADVAPR